MDKIPVISSNISDIAYENGTLTVWFKSGSAYNYQCPQEVFDAMRNAPSVGSYFANNVKGLYQGQRVE
jgi:hypothetical protein